MQKGFGVLVHVSDMERVLCDQTSAPNPGIGS